MPNTMNPLENHLSWQLADVMKEICAPLHDTLQINYVDYARYYPDGRIVSLFTDKAYVNSFAQDLVTSKTPNKIITAGLHLWSEYINRDFLTLASKQFRHEHGITILTEFNDYSEIFNLATYPENTEILAFYLNQQAILQQILNFIRKKAKKWINKVEDQPLIIPNRKIETAPIKPVDDKLLALINEMNSYEIKINNISVSLSKREAQCVHYLHQGKTAKEIARALDISHRTIEIYLDQVRSKTDSKSRIELLSKINKNQLEHLAIAL